MIESSFSSKEQRAEDFIPSHRHSDGCDERCKENCVSCFNITVKLKFLGLFSTPLLMLITNRSIIVMKKYWFLKFNKNAIWRLCWLWLEGRSGVVGKLEGGYFFPLVSMQQSLRMWKEIYWNYLSSTPNKSLLKITRKCLQSEKRKCVGNHADILSELFVVILRVSTFTSDISRYISSLISLRLTFDWNPKPNTTFCFH